MKKTTTRNLSILLGLLLMNACNNKEIKNESAVISIEELRGKRMGVPVKLPPFNPDNDIPAPPEYSEAECWLQLPAHFDKEKQAVDVFWVYPTLLSDDSTYLMDIYDSSLRAKACWTLVEQDSVFDGQANIYAPYYRQNNIRIIN